MQDREFFDEVIPPRSFGYGSTFIDPQLRPVASKLAVAVWILALPAMVPAVGVLAALPLLIVSIVLLAQRDPLPHDRRVGTAGLILALISLTVTTASVVRHRVSEQGRTVPPELRAAIADKLRESGESQATIDEIVDYLAEREAGEAAERAEHEPSDGDAALDSAEAAGAATGADASEAAMSDDDVLDTEAGAPDSDGSDGPDGATGSDRSAGTDESDASAEADDLKMSWAQGVLYCIVLVVSLMFHEIGHAMAAYWSGDPTARERGRFSLNPIKHLSLVGSVIVPGILILMKSDTVIGWAKPVPVSPMRLRHYRRGSLAVGVSGVSLNLMIAGAGATLLVFTHLVMDLLFPGSIVLDSPVPFVAPVIVGAKGETFWIVLICLCKAAIWVNVFLAVFNLLPLPPLDGFGVVQSLVPNKLAAWMEKLSRAGLIIFAILLATNVLDKLLLPAIYIGLFFFGMVRVLTG